jgi:tRNA(Ile)-lysidine synthase
VHEMLVQRIRRTIEAYHLLEKGDRVIAGVSGGVDSMVLLRLLYNLAAEYDLSLIVGHVNHGLRPGASEKEAELVRAESEQLGLPFEYGEVDVKAFQKAKGLSTQDAARRLRFHFFNALLTKHGAAKLALGHHADDQVETFMLRLIRGSGLKGLQAMAPVRQGRVIRPLLEVWRKEIELFAESEGVPFLTDASNLEEHYLRNKVRLSLLPLIEKEYQPNFKPLVLRTTALLREENEALDREAQKAVQELVRKESGVFAFRFLKFRGLHRAVQRRVLQRIFDEIRAGEGIMEEKEGPAVNRLHRLLIEPRPSFSLELPGKIFFEKRYDDILIGKKEAALVSPFEIEIAASGQTFIKEVGKRIVAEELVRKNWTGDFDKTSQTVFLDWGKVQFPLTVRNFRPGDRFHPLGVKGTQKLKEFFIDHKVPRFERSRIPILVSGGSICWVAGFRIDDRFKVTEETERVLKVKLI